MKIALSNYQVKLDGKKIGFYQKDTIGISKWYAEYDYKGTKYVKSAPTLNDLRYYVKSSLYDTDNL